MHVCLSVHLSVLLVCWLDEHQEEVAEVCGGSQCNSASAQSGVSLHPAQRAAQDPSHRAAVQRELLGLWTGSSTLWSSALFSPPSLPPSLPAAAASNSRAVWQ